MILMRSVLLTLFLTAPLVAQSQAPYPAYSGEAVTVVGVPDQYQSVREAIQSVQENSRQRYFVVVVNSTGSGNFATEDYTDNLLDRWIQEAAQKQTPFPGGRAVLIVAAMQNRQLAVNAGGELQDQYGLKDTLLKQELIEPHFIPYARRNDYAGGLVKLIEAIEARIRDQDRQQSLLAEQRRLQAEQLKLEAETTLTRAAVLQPGVEQLLNESQQAGLNVESLRQRLSQTNATLAAARVEQPANPQAALDKGLSVLNELTAIQGELAGLTRLQGESRNRFAVLQQQLIGVDELRLQREKEGLPVQGLRTEIEQARTDLNALEPSLTTALRQSLERLQRLEGTIGVLRSRLEKLPQWQQSLLAVAEQARKDRDELRAIYETAEASGAVTASHRAQWNALNEQLAKADRLAESQSEAAQAGYQQALTRMKSLREDLRSASRWSYFKSRVLPWMLAVVVLAIILRILAGQWLRHFRLRHEVGQELEAFKKSAVAINDRLDQLRERHKMLPEYDKDFQVPMLGETLGLYNSIQDQLAVYRDRWLDVMDGWDRAQKLMQEETWYGSHKYTQARNHLDQIDVEALQQEIERELKGGLDRLEQAHETAAACLEATSEHRIGWGRQLDALQQHGIDTAALQKEYQRQEQLTEQTRPLMVADPLGVQARLQTIRAEIERRQQQGQTLIQLCEQLQKLRERWERAGQLIAGKQREGFLFAEPEGDPRELHARAAQHLVSLERDVKQGDVEASLAHQQNLEADLRELLGLVERLVWLRENCGPGLTAQQEAVAGFRAQLQALRTGSGENLPELQQSFPPQQSAEVADRLQFVGELVGKVETGLEEVVQAIRDDVQHYLRAESLLSDLGETQQELRLLIQGIRDQLAKLFRQRTEYRSRQTYLLSRSDAIRQLLDSNTADRPQANQQYQLAHQRLQEIAEQGRQPRNNWLALLDRLQGVDNDLNSAEQLARQDMQLAAQAEREISAAQREIRQAGAFYRQGVSPNVREAEALLDTATRLLQSQAYERVFEVLQQARESARRAEEQARRAAADKEAELERERERRMRDQLSQLQAGPILTTVATIAAEALRQGGTSAGSGRRERRSSHSSFSSSGRTGDSGSSSFSGGNSPSTPAAPRDSGTSASSWSGNRDSGTASSSW